MDKIRTHKKIINNLQLKAVNALSLNSVSFLKTYCTLLLEWETWPFQAGLTIDRDAGNCISGAIAKCHHSSSILLAY